MVSTAPIEFRPLLRPQAVPWTWLVRPAGGIDPCRRYSRMSVETLKVAQECAAAFVRTAARKGAT